MADETNEPQKTPESQEPESQQPESQAPESQAPESQAPESQVPESQAPGSASGGADQEQPATTEQPVAAEAGTPQSDSPDGDTAPAAGTSAEGWPAGEAAAAEGAGEAGEAPTVERPSGEAPDQAAETPQPGRRKAEKPRSSARSSRSGGGEAAPAGPEGGEVEESVVKVYRCAAVVKGGRRFSFAALVVAGDRNGRVGLGYGKANEVPNAVEKASKSARRNMRRIRLDGTTIPHKIRGRYGASKVEMIPAVAGTGVIAGASVRAVLELAGVKDVLTKCHGSTSPKNLVKAAYEGLVRLRSKEDIERLREVPLAG